ncbi:MAG: hypothetical protein KGO49_00495 [Gammaproteobacteria bacterium]|nr:hypothetical protein [Gammaproteobacteria bacterium]
MLQSFGLILDNVVFGESLPIRTTGKIIQHQLHERFADHTALETGLVKQTLEERLFN